MKKVKKLVVIFNDDSKAEFDFSKLSDETVVSLGVLLVALLASIEVKKEMRRRWRENRMSIR